MSMQGFVGHGLQGAARPTARLRSLQYRGSDILYFFFVEDAFLILLCVRLCINFIPRDAD